METALTEYCPLGWGKNGEQLERAYGQTGWGVRDASNVGRPVTMRNEDRSELILPYDASIEDLCQSLDGKFGRMLLDPTNDEGEVIEGAPVAQVSLRQPLSHDPHEQTRQMCQTFIGFIESKDILITKMATALIESNRTMHADTSNVLRATSSLIDVASGFERPELDVNVLTKKLSEAVKEADGEPKQREHWILTLLNGNWGQAMLDFIGEKTPASK